MSEGNKNSPRLDSKGANHILSQRRELPRSRGPLSLLTAVVRALFYVVGNAKLRKRGEIINLSRTKQPNYSGMTLYDALTISGRTLAALRELGYKAGDERYMPMLRDYLEMVDRGDKITYAVAIVANRYGISERTVYNVVKRFSAHRNGVAAG